MAAENQNKLLTVGGRIVCRRCQAKSKRHGGQCGAPAIRGKRVCKTHGGRSCGPKTEQGRQRCTEAKTIHGRETRVKRKQASELSALMKLYAQVLGVKYRSDPLLGGSLRRPKRKFRSTS